MKYRCAEQREAHRARLMRFAFAQHILLIQLFNLVLKGRVATHRCYVSMLPRSRIFDRLQMGIDIDIVEFVFD